MVLVPIIYNRFDMETMDKNMQSFIATISDDELETVKRCIHRWDMWAESMRVE